MHSTAVYQKPYMMRKSLITMLGDGLLTAEGVSSRSRLSFYLGSQPCLQMNSTSVSAVS